jgi:hypothetical protein
MHPLKCQATYLYGFIALACRALFFFFFLKEEFIQATILERTAIGQDDSLEKYKRAHNMSWNEFESAMIRMNNESAESVFRQLVAYVGIPQRTSSLLGRLGQG